MLDDNEVVPDKIQLSGTGATGAAGQSGSDGAPGSAGGQGPAGPQGPPAQIMLVSCTTARKKVKGHRVRRRKCTTKLISGVATFTTTPTRAQLTRGRVVYASGSAWPYDVTLDASRRITPGRYTLTLRRGGLTTRQPVVID